MEKDLASELRNVAFQTIAVIRQLFKRDGEMVPNNPKNQLVIFEYCTIKFKDTDSPVYATSSAL